MMKNRSLGKEDYGREVMAEHPRRHEHSRKTKRKSEDLTQILGSNSSRESGKRDGGGKRKLSQAS